MQDIITKLVKVLGIMCCVVTFINITATSLQAQTDIFIRGSGRMFPIAVPQLCLQTGDTTANKDLPKVVQRDLELSGYFEVIDPGGYLEAPGKCSGSQEFAYSDWSVIGAEGLVKGTVSYDGRTLRAQLFLHDVQRQKVVLGKEYEGDLSQINKIGHKFANEIMRIFTGEFGVFGTQIAYSSKVGRFRELFVMDMDGSNIRQLTNDRALSVSASWDPLGTNLVYTSYRERMPNLFILNIPSRSLRQITRGPALELGAQFSKAGNSILASQSTDGLSQILLFNSDGGVVRQITPKSRFIDVSPDWSPDESQVAFCSNRGGGPQIYVVGTDGAGARRVSFVNSSYCTSPSWSPKGDRLAFVCRAEGGFQIFTVNPDGSDPLQLTSVGDNEDPDWAPNGKYIVFATTFGKGYTKSLALMREDGSSIRRLTTSRLGDSDPAWGPLN